MGKLIRFSDGFERCPTCGFTSQKTLGDDKIEPEK